MLFHCDTKENVIQTLFSDINKGLSDREAEKRIDRFGYNQLEEGKKKSNVQRFFDQFKDAMIIILIVAAIISFVIACLQGEGKEFFEPVLILIIVFLNAFMGVMQENKAEKALEGLKKLSAPHAKVIRDGVVKEIEAKFLVPGDIILLEAGDFVPADARLLQCASLKSEESALTGESIPAEKNEDSIVLNDAGIGDRCNMVFSGCTISYGVGTAVVTNTGMQTEMGKIADLLHQENRMDTPLQKKLSQLGKLLGVLAISACGVIFVVGVMNDIPTIEIFMTAVSLAVSAIPEGLPAIVTIVLSIGVMRMVKKNAIIRRLPAVETLGSASIICSDKTGTLTQNRMTLTKAYVGALEVEDICADNCDEIRKLLTYGVLCCDSSISFENNTVTPIGDPTETAIIYAAYKNGIYKNVLNNIYPRLKEFPFDSDRKRMSTIHLINDKRIVIVKGAFDVLSQLCVSGDLNGAKKINDELSEMALRVLAIAYKEIDDFSDDAFYEVYENELHFMGLVGMIDPPRDEVKTSVAICKDAGIKPVMITGDHIVTACAIAKELGIFVNGDLAITGAELDQMSEDTLIDKIASISVYARVSPQNKIRIVKAWQQKNQVVAMTGDGVNDAPALKAADIGCAMGITGTDVAKDAADITLSDDNFATIVDAIREGRGIYANIKKVVGFLLGTNIGEVISVFVAMILWHKSPLLSMQLLWINLVTDSMPAIALGMEPVESDIMFYKPKPKDESIFAHGLGIRVFLQGLMFGVLTLIGFYVGEHVMGELAAGQTLAFMTLSFTQVVQAFNMRSEHSLFRIGVFSNPHLNVAGLISTILIALVLFTPLSIAFGLIYLPVKLYLFGLLLSCFPILVMEFSKAMGLIKHMK